MRTYSELQSEIRPYLHLNETLLWIGAPSSAKLPKKAVSSALPALLGIIFIIFWIVAAMEAGALFIIFGILFAFVTFRSVFKSTIGLKIGLKNSIYAVTEDRAIIVITDRKNGTNCIEYPFSDLSGVFLENVKDNIGTIRFEDVNIYAFDSTKYSNRQLRSVYSPERELTTAFVSIDDVHKVYHMISERTEK